jgi:hypothetical protein
MPPLSCPRIKFSCYPRPKANVVFNPHVLHKAVKVGA